MLLYQNNLHVPQKTIDFLYNTRMYFKNRKQFKYSIIIDCSLKHGIHLCLVKRFQCTACNLFSKKLVDKKNVYFSNNTIQGTRALYARQNIVKYHRTSIKSNMFRIQTF